MAQGAKGDKIKKKALSYCKIRTQRQNQVRKNVSVTNIFRKAEEFSSKMVIFISYRKIETYQNEIRRENDFLP